MSNWLHIDEVSAGMLVDLDENFTCTSKQTVRLYNERHGSPLGFACDEGFHNLDGQLDEHGYLVGITEHIPKPRAFKQLSDDEWESQFIPVANHIVPQNGDQYETYGDEAEYVLHKRRSDRAY